MLDYVDEQKQRKSRQRDPLSSQAYTWGPHGYRQIVENTNSPRLIETIEQLNRDMKSLGEVEESLAEKVEPVLGFKPSSNSKEAQLEFSFTLFVGLLPSSH